MAHWFCQWSFLPTTARHRWGHVAFFPKTRTLSIRFSPFIKSHQPRRPPINQPPLRHHDCTICRILRPPINQTRSELLAERMDVGPAGLPPTRLRRFVPTGIDAVVTITFVRQCAIRCWPVRGRRAASGPPPRGMSVNIQDHGTARREAISVPAVLLMAGASSRPASPVKTHHNFQPLPGKPNWRDRPKRSPEAC